jgi:F0F1-type ATP synthase membrane subunit b/b'
MRLRLSGIKIKRKYISWLVLIVLILIGVFAYFYREPLGKIFVPKKTAVIEKMLEPTETIPELKEEEEKALSLKEKEGKIVEKGQMPASEEGEKIYVEIAEYGEGITHLARKALNKYLAEKGEHISLTKAHKIYIEDYMQNKTGDRWLKLGEKISFSEKLIEEAIEHALKLSEAQLQNILSFTPPPTFVE